MSKEKQQSDWEKRVEKEFWKDMEKENPQQSEWEKEFDKRFGAEKIWVVPSEDNMQTIEDIKSFISTQIQQARAGARAEVLKEAVKIVDKYQCSSGDNILWHLKQEIIKKWGIKL